MAVSSRSQTSFSFRPEYKGEQLKLDVTYHDSSETWIRFTTLRFYISNIRYSDITGKSVKGPNCILVDLEEQSSLTLPALPEGISMVEFTLGTDSLTNVSGILEGPLDPINGMYWAWNSGYINFKLEGNSSEVNTPKKEFEYHIGGYMPPYPTARECRFEIDPSQDHVSMVVDIEKWLKATNLKENPNVMIPGQVARDLSDALKHCISICYDR